MTVSKKIVALIACRDVRTIPLRSCYFKTGKMISRVIKSHVYTVESIP